MLKARQATKRWFSRLLGRGRGASPEHSDVRLLSDEPIHDAGADYFGFDKFAAALTQIVDHPETDTPITIALSAPWGAGKTSVALMMKGMLEERVELRDRDRERIICQFNAWEHDDADHLGAALASDVARTVDRYRPLWRRVTEPLPWAMLGPQARWRRVVLLGGISGLAAVLAAVIVPTREFAEQFLGLKASVVSGFGWLGLIWILALIWPVLFSRARDAAKFVDEPRSEAARGSMAQVKDQLGRLVRQATGDGRVVIFVDDLERCRPERAVEVFEVSGQLLAHPGVVTVLLADMRSLFSAALTAYRGKTSSADPELGRRYLEKLVQLQLELPPPRASDMSRLLQGLPARDLPQKAPAEQPLRSTASLVEVQSWSFYVASLGLAFALIWWLGGSIGTRDSSQLRNVALVAAVGGVVGLLTGVVTGIWRLQLRRQRQEVDQKVEQTAAAETEGSRTSDDLVRDAAVKENLWAYAGQVAERVRTVRYSEVEAVEDFIQRHPPRFPRGAKRMLNHARLLSKIARERQMFGGAPELTPDHLGKWIVLGERWPECAEAISSSALRFETEGELRAFALALFDGPADKDLEALLVQGPELHGVIRRLVYFEPAKPVAKADPGRVAEPVG